MNDDAKKLCCVIGDPIDHSLSPLIHNAGYEALKIQDQFKYVSFQVNKNNIEKNLATFRSMGVVGISVTLPLKVEIINHLDQVSDSVKKIGAVNTVVDHDGKWIGSNTDYLGILRPLESLVDLEDAYVGVIGASGAGRSAVYALTLAGAKVTIFNRTVSKAEKLANEFKCDARPLSAISDLVDYDIIINCTSLGMNEFDLMPVPINVLNEEQIVFDCVYSHQTTDLLEAAKSAGAKTIHGVEMFIEQAFEQFKLFTGHEIPKNFFRKKLYQHFEWEIDS